MRRLRLTFDFNQGFVWFCSDFPSKSCQFKSKFECLKADFIIGSNGQDTVKKSIHNPDTLQKVFSHKSQTPFSHSHTRKKLALAASLDNYRAIWYIIKYSQIWFGKILANLVWQKDIVRLHGHSMVYNMKETHKGACKYYISRFSLILDPPPPPK